MGMGEGAQAMADIASSSNLLSNCRRVTPRHDGRRRPGHAGRQLGDERRSDARTLAELERTLMNQGFLDRGSDGQWRLSPKAMRQLGQAALRDVAQRLSVTTANVTRVALARQGSSPGRRGHGSSATPNRGTSPGRSPTRCYASRDGRRRAAHAAHGGRRRDLRDRDAHAGVVALLVDTSFSMVMENRWLPMKRTALALNHLVSTRFARTRCRSSRSVGTRGR